MDAYDLVILGSGSTAFAAAIRAAELGFTVAMTESRTLGGTCVNRGCLPSKNLIEAARIVWDARRPRYPGLRCQGMDVDFAALVAQKDEVIDAYREKKYAAIVNDSERISVYPGRARFGPDGVVEVDGRRLVGKHVLIATGSRPFLPPIEGLDRVPYLTSDLLESAGGSGLAQIPRSLVVVGGGYIALELGQMFCRFGSAVTILERSPRVLPSHEPEVSGAITRALVDEGVNVVTGIAVRAVRPEGDGVAVTGERQGREVTFRADHLLVAAGRKPNTDGLGLEHVGVRTDEAGFVVVDAFLRTTAPKVWAAGDVIGRQWDAHQATPVGAHDGVIAATNALGTESRRVDHSVVPRTIFTDPQVATVGLTDAEAKRHGYRCSCRAVPMALVPRAAAVRDPRGVVKMVVEAGSTRVLGVSMVGVDAGEVIHEAAMALRFGATVHDFIDLVHVYPTMAEALKIVALSFYKDVERLSCCAE
ncbi:MAG: mercury(II) reductase [Armatimonadota bacterium]|nr:mercury(II) reductase [Armatimonadota bacterium]